MSEKNEHYITKEKMLPLILTIIVIVADQITKALVVRYIPRVGSFFVDSGEGVIQIIGNYLRLIHVRNNAVAFSMGSNLPDTARHIFFAILPLLIIIAVFVIYFRNTYFTSIQRWAICGVLGGGIGNLIDRFFRKDGVVDFIDCYFGGLFGLERWPTFNIADSAIVVCGLLFLITFLVESAKESKKGRESNNE